MGARELLSTSLTDTRSAELYRRAVRVLPGGDGHGLIGMRERVTMYGGRFTAGPRPEGGFAVSAAFPY